MSIAPTPQPPYYAVVFTSLLGRDDAGYGEMARVMAETAARQPGFLGVESVREGAGPGAPGITVSYWRSLEDIAAWKTDAAHQMAQRLGRQRWYAAYKTRICRVERDYDFAAG
ncbi:MULTISPECIES: antibiotic biosynthesis monooxygenase [Nguyenibacter]|uniref:Antibiotic biosynthesis monooxygenase n=1 Tax=Nguyenibacter vanlangensis TaxID=1216886 RepID=A0A7Y7M7D9_9PROT|nr:MULTISPECIES: antibiotic biosynthesis monooxygenase [Nguyenibacter]NVN12997.1 antibiotic biosynthesis monooxygenase [Nguyenibacter vanlangensis]WRH87399.1 antibiotic biosynthesis monooxygenase [Nguyenibacter sp. L1]